MIFPSSNAVKRFFFVASPQLNSNEEFSLGSLIESLITMGKFLKEYTGIFKML